MNLKACPFCGCDEILMVEEGIPRRKKKYIYCMCLICCSRGKDYIFEPRKNYEGYLEFLKDCAIKSWNKRINLDA